MFDHSNQKVVLVYPNYHSFVQTEYIDVNTKESKIGSLYDRIT